MPTEMVGIDGGLAGAEPDETPGAWPAREARPWAVLPTRTQTTPSSRGPSTSIRNPGTLRR